MVHHDVDVCPSHHLFTWFNLCQCSCLSGRNPIFTHSLPNAAVMRMCEQCANIIYNVIFLGCYNCFTGALQLSLWAKKKNLLSFSELSAPCTPVLHTLCICVQACVCVRSWILHICAWLCVSGGGGGVLPAVCTCQSVHLSVSTVAKSLNDFQHPSPLPVWRWIQIHHGERTLYHWGYGLHTQTLYIKQVSFICLCPFRLEIIMWSVLIHVQDKWFLQGGKENVMSF